MHPNFVLILEDKKSIYDEFARLFIANELKLQLLYCATYEEYHWHMRDAEIRNNVKCLIMDLANNANEDETFHFEATKLIEMQYSKNRIPIFIHSDYLSYYENLVDRGTIIRKEKTAKSVVEIIETIKLMEETGFFHIFSIGGTLEQKIMSEIHTAFVGQFKPNEIEGIMKSIKSANPENIESRTKEVFERIALRAVYQNVVSNISTNESFKVNSIEHYYRRTDRKDFYTGDIFVKKGDDTQLIFVASPRCNLSNNNYEELLLCKINLLKDDQLKSFLSTKIDDKKTGETKGLKQLRTSVTDDVTNSFIGERFRFLPKTPQFEGGFVDCLRCFSIDPKEFKEKYEYVISLVDDLTNDVVRKLSGYILRGGISDTSYQEALYYLQELEDNNTQNSEPVESTNVK